MYVSGLVLNKLGTPALIASSLAALISFVVSYVLQKYWVFSARSVSTGKSVARFILVTSFTWTIGLGWVWFADAIIQLAYEWSQLVLTVLVAVLNFTINKLWTFRQEEVPLAAK